MRVTNETSETVQMKYKHVKCKICECAGRDKSNSLFGVRCEKCNGSGWRLFPEGQTEKCPVCVGRGKDYRFSFNGKVCQECDGFGEIKLLT